jgi:hypothetical protein
MAVPQSKIPVIGFQDDHNHSPPIVQTRAMSTYVHATPDQYGGLTGQAKIKGLEIDCNDTVQFHADMAALKKIHRTEDASWINGKTVMFIGPGTARLARGLYNLGGRYKSAVFVENSRALAVAQQHGGQLPSPSCTLVTDISTSRGYDWAVEQLKLGHQHDPNMPTKFDFIISFHQFGDIEISQSRMISCLSRLAKPEEGSFILSYGMADKRAAFLCAPKDWRLTISTALTPYYTAGGDKATMRCSQHTKDVISLDWTSETTKQFNAALPVRIIHKSSIKHTGQVLRDLTGMVFQMVAVNSMENILTSPTIQLSMDQYRGPQNHDKAIASYLQAQYEAKMREQESEIRKADDAFRLGVESWPIPFEPVYFFQNKKKKNTAA